MRSPGAEGPFRIGVDVGGTFTDVCVVDGAGALHAVKSPSVPMDPAAGVFSALEQTARTLRLSISDLLSRTSVFVHGSTIATNTLLERKGARVGLLATRGFRDTIEIRRGWRENPWDHRTPWPAPLVPRHLRWGVAERISADGAVLQPLQWESLHEAIDELQARGVESIAVCLLHSHRNQEHEAVCRKVIARRAPDLWISLSCELAPLIGEYERSSTTVVNAYVAPKVVPYLRSLEQRLQAFGLGGLLVVRSNGGMASVSQVARRPVSTILSGPAAAAGALTQYAADAGSQNLISIEVGGTSCDVMLMNRGSIGVTDLLDVGGFRMTVPSVEITTVGAGGGSLAR